MSDSYDGVPRKIEWADDPATLHSTCKEQLLVMTADRDAWRDYANHLAFYRSWANTLAKALDNNDAAKAYELARGYMGIRGKIEF